VVGYNVYSGGASQTYTNMVSIGNVTNASVLGLAQGRTYFFSVTAVDSLGVESPFSNETSYSVPTNTPPVVTNTPPSITGIAAQTINVNTGTGPLPFSVTDLQTPASGLTVSAASSNPTLVPASGIVLTNSGANWTVTVTPASGQTGTATISLTVCDTSLCTTTNFLLTVLAPPVITLTSPSRSASYTAPASITLAASVTANGHVISKVQFLNGTSVIGQSTSSTYNFNWNGVAAGTYSLVAQAVYDSGAVVTTPAVSVTVNTAPLLPPPWQTADLGTVGISGSAVSSNGVFTVTGAGNISGSSDNFRFLYQTLSGDGEIRAQLVSAQNVGSGDLSAVMIRETLTSGSKYALMGFSPGGNLRWQRRYNTSGGTSTGKGGYGSPPKLWVRVVRTGNTFYGYKSTDGSSWTQVASYNITMASNIYVGLAVASGNSGILATSMFSNVTVVP
jgi:hypothetical protein